MPTPNTATKERALPGDEGFTPPFTVRETAAKEFSPMRDWLDQIERGGAGATVQAGNDPAAAPVTATVTRRRRRATSGRSAPQMSDTTAQAAPAPTAQPTHNVPTFEYYMGKADELGKLAGQGKNTGVTFLLECLEGGYVGALNTDPAKHGDEQGDHFKLAAKYATSQGIAAQFDAKGANQRKLMSNIKSVIDFGGNPKWGHGEPIGVVNTLMTQWRALRKKGTGGLQDAYNMLLKFIVAQRKRDTLIDGDELTAFCYKSGARPLSAERVLEAIRRTATRLSQGKLTNCPEMDDSPEIKAIVNACTKRLTAIAKAKGAAAKQGGKQAEAA